MPGSKDDRADDFAIFALQVSEKDFSEMAKFIGTKQPDPLKAFMFASAYIGWVIAMYQECKILPPQLIAKLPDMCAQVSEHIYNETRRKHDKAGESSSAPQGPA